MGTERSGYRHEIAVQASSFRAYVDTVLLKGKERQVLDLLSEQCDVYVFGGVIRNYLLGYPFHRDLDFVVCAKGKLTLPVGLLHGMNITRNKFGGVKLTLPNFTIDIWGLSNTWGIQEIGGKATPYTLIRTVFFNFSAIVFDYNRKRFIYTDDFMDFYSTKVMNLVYGRNPYPTACVINTCYYAQEYGFSVGKRLRAWIAKQKLDEDIETQQVRRYGEVKTPESVVKAFVKVCKMVESSNALVEIYDVLGTQYLFKFE